MNECTRAGKNLLSILKAFKEFFTASSMFTVNWINQAGNVEATQVAPLSLMRYFQFQLFAWQGIVIDWRGEYDDENTYQTGDGVMCKGQCWVAQKPNLIGVTPTEGNDWKRCSDCCCLKRF